LAVSSVGQTVVPLSSDLLWRFGAGFALLEEGFGASG
jgi:hypothetical protein